MQKLTMFMAYVLETKTVDVYDHVYGLRAKN